MFPIKHLKTVVWTEEFLKDFGVYRIKIYEEKSTKSKKINVMNCYQVLKMVVKYYEIVCYLKYIIYNIYNAEYIT